MEQGKKEEIEEKVEVSVPDITGKTIKEAESILKESGLEIVITSETEGMNKEQVNVRTQMPQAGINVYKGSSVYIEY